MNTNDVFAADSDSLALDVFFYNKLFTDFLQEFAKGQPILPEITDPILEANGAGPEYGPFRTLLYAFVGGVEAGLDIAMKMPEKS